MTLAHDNPTRYAENVRRALLPPLAGLTILAALLVWQIGTLIVTLGQAADSGHVIATADRLQRLLIDMETGERGYLVGGAPLFLQPYREASTKIDSTFAELDQRVANDPGQSERIQAIRSQYVLWVQEAHREMGRRDTVAADGIGYAAYFNRARGKMLMDDLRGRIDTVIESARAARNRRNERAQLQGRQVLYLAGFSTLLIGGLVTLTTRRSLSDLSRQYESLLDAEQRAREYLGATLVSIGDAVLVTDSGGCVTTMNPIAEALTGWHQSEASGRDAGIVLDFVDHASGAAVESPVARALRDGVVVSRPDPTALRRRDGTTIPVEDSGAPIRDRDGAIVGVVVVFRDIGERRREEAERLATADKNSRIAETLQRSLLLTPSAGVFPGLNVAMRYQSALDEAQLGGDFFDAFALDDRTVAFVVGDVTGKGLTAASFTAEVKFALRAMLREYSHPATALMRLNRFLIESHRLDGRSEYALVALSLAVVDSWTGDVRVAVAGAEPPILARADREAAAIEILAAGSLLGVDPATEYESGQTERMQPGDRLVLMSDGITEARRGRNEFLGSDGVIRLLYGCAGATDADEVATALLDGATAFAGGRLRDDVCLVVVQRASDAPLA